MALKARNELDPKFQWNLSELYPSQDDWESAYRQAEADVTALAALPGTLGASPEALKTGLDRIYAVGETVERLYLYGMLQKAGDNGDPAAQRLEGRAMTLYVAYSAAISFVDPEILAIPDLETWMADPRLAGYRHILEDTARSRAHTLPAAQEKLLSQLQDAAGTPDNCFTMLESVDMTFPDIPGEDGEPAPLSHGTYITYLQSPSQAVRKAAHETLLGEFQAHINTLAAMYGGSVKLDGYFSTVRGYDSPCQMALFRNNVPLSVYDSLVEAVHGGLPVMERYLRLRKKALGLETLNMYDLYCPMVPEVRYTVTYDEAFALVRRALAPLGEDYLSLLDRAHSERWMDVYENRGKTTGAFSCGVYGVHPYVLLNFSGGLEDVFTMAHELGHAMHSYFSSQCNDYANHDYRILVAEVASTVNEVLLTRYLLKTETDSKRRAYLLNHLLESFRTTVFRQTLFAEFERRAHDLYQDGEPLTAEVLTKLYHDLNVQYYPGVSVSAYQDVEWSRIPHFYSAFYVYQYATGFCSAVAIADGILKRGDASAYRKFLTTGGSDYPLEELKMAGVDLTRPETVETALAVCQETLEELERLL